MSKFVFRLAKANKKFPNEIYKNMIKNSNLIVKRASLRLFKEAFHSPKTPPEYRAILLSSLYHDRPNFRDLIKRTSKIPDDLQKITFQIIEEKGQKHFSLVGWRGYRATLTGFVPKKPYRIGLSPDVKKHIHNWSPQALKQKILTTSLHSGKMQFQKVALLFENITRCLFDMAHITREFVFLNDPRRKYNTSPEKSLKKEWDEAYFTGYFAESARIFKEDLEHMMDEFEKYTPHLERMGFNVWSIRNPLQVVYDNLSFYKNKSYNNNTAEEEDALYEVHDNTGAFIRSLLEMAGKIEDLDENSPEIYEFGRLEVFPEYVPYRRHSSVVTRSLDAIDEGITYKLERIKFDLHG